MSQGTSTICRKFQYVDQETFDVCTDLTGRYPDLSFGDFDTGVQSVVVTDKGKRVVEGKPDGDVSAREVKRLALEKATDEYAEYAKCFRRNGGPESCGDFSSLFMHDLKGDGMFVPWFFYDEQNFVDAIRRTEGIVDEWDDSGDIMKAGLAMYDTVRTDYGIDYRPKGNLKIAGLDGIVANRVASCEEIAFMLKGLALVAGMPLPRVYETLRDDKPYDHVFSSFDLGDGDRLFIDPRQEPFVAKEHPGFSDSVEASGLYMLSLYELNFTSRNCDTTECRLGHARRTLDYAPTYKSYYVLATELWYADRKEEARSLLPKICGLNPSYFVCESK